MNKLFDELSVPIKIYVGVEEIQDPYEKNIKETLLTPIPIKAIVTELSPAKAQWVMIGITSEKTKQIICKKIHRPLIEQSRKITVKGDSSEYYGYKVNGRLSITEEGGDYIRCYIYVKKES